MQDEHTWYTCICCLIAWYIHRIYWCKMNTHGAANLYLVCIVIYMTYVLNIKRTFMEYQWYIIIKKCMEQTKKCFTMFIWWNLHMTGIYHVHTMSLYIPYIDQTGCDITVIYQEYKLYIPQCIYQWHFVKGFFYWIPNFSSNIKFC
jgi:hypothetical protein